jgi:hypothetical protein
MPIAVDHLNRVPRWTEALKGARSLMPSEELWSVDWQLELRLKALAALRVGGEPLSLMICGRHREPLIEQGVTALPRRDVGAREVVAEDSRSQQVTSPADMI